MSRSYKKPYISTTCAGARPGVQKKWKKEYNRRIRRISPHEELPGSRVKQLVSDAWVAPNDGKCYWEGSARWSRK